MTEEQTSGSNNIYLIASSIVVAGLLIAGAVIYANGPLPPQSANVSDVGNNVPDLNFRPVSSDDHIFGSPDAPVKIIEYSDLECPFCKGFHQLMLNDFAADYIQTGKVAWIYRHLPLDSLHSKARSESVAAECAASLAGNDGFWKFIDAIFAETPSNNGLDPARLPAIAKIIGLDEKAFSDCVTSDAPAARVAADEADARAAGAGGTPFIIVVSPSGEKTAIPGLPNPETFKTILDRALTTK